MSWAPGDDKVWLTIGGVDVEVSESFQVTCGVFHQPASWRMRLGWGDVAWDLLQAHKPGAEFKIRIAGNLQQTGWLDGVDANGSVGATEVTLHGRDALARLYDSEVEFEESFNNETFSGLVRRALAKVGLKDRSVALTNAANRKIRAGVAVVETQPTFVIDEIKRAGGTGKEFVGVVRMVQAAKAGERWLMFVRKIIDRSGLFLWADAQGNFVLAQPHANQLPVARIVRRRGASLSPGNVELVEYKNDTTSRHSECVVYGRSGRIRTKAKGGFVDQEMIDFGLIKKLVIRDTNCTSPAQAAFLARRKIAEERRAGWSLKYKVAGFTVPSLTEPGKRVVWSPDTVVEVDDYELGLIHKRYYVEQVVYEQNPSATTSLSLMRPEDLVFGEVG